MELASFIRPSVRAGKIDELSSDIQDQSCRPKASSSSVFFDRRYCLCLKTLSYICSQTRTAIANYCLLPWERMEIVQGILGENLFFSASCGGCCVSRVGLYCRIPLGNLCLQNAL